MLLIYVARKLNRYLDGPKWVDDGLKTAGCAFTSVTCGLLLGKLLVLGAVAYGCFWLYSQFFGDDEETDDEEVTERQAEVSSSFGGDGGTDNGKIVFILTGDTNSDTTAIEQ